MLRRLIPDAPQTLYLMLDAAAGPLQPPIRAEIFGAQRFAEHARSLGETHRAGAASWHRTRFFPRLRANVRMLHAAQRYMVEPAGSGDTDSPAADWLLDNFHLIESQLQDIREALPRPYFRTLPVLQDEPLAGLPRIYGVAWAFVAHTDGAFDEDLLQQFLCAYQQTRELSLGEMWALPTNLRVVLVESLSRLAERLAAHKAAREAARLCYQRGDAWDMAAMDELLELLRRRGTDAVFLAQLWLSLQDGQGAERTGLRAWARRVLPDPAPLLAQQEREQTADNLSVSNAVGSLRRIAGADWPELISRSSALIGLLQGAPLFAAEHADTRDQSLHAIEHLARRSGRGEMAVARLLLDLMRRAAASADEPSAAPGYWLRDAGRPELLRALGLPNRASRWQPCVLPLYLGALTLLSLVLTGWLLRGQVLPAWAWPGAALLVLLPASEAVVALLHRLISESLRPVPLPRLALAGGIPADHRVLVVIPALLSDKPTIDALCRRLLLHQLANPEHEAQFALLGDWTDADAAALDADAPLLEHALAALAELNAGAEAQPGTSRFVLLQRERRYCITEQRWIGWERKRGKLEQLIAQLAGGPTGAFLDLGAASTLAPDIRYLVTLDSDTWLPPGTLRDLVGAAAHPANRPRLAADGRSVCGGFAILQPRLVMPLPAPVEATGYHRLFAGQAGIDPYSAAGSEIYQDLFGEGSYSGKGLLQVQAMHQLLGDRLPADQVLSHDLLEGALARCARLGDVALIEAPPAHPDVAAARLHRWMRGDWQLLPLLLQAARYPLGALNRWKLFDNLRRSLVAPAGLGLLLLSLAGQLMAPWVALILVMAAFCAGPTLGALAGLTSARVDLARRHFYKLALAELARALAGGLWQLAMLPGLAGLALDAVARTLYRLLFSRRHLLQWTTAAAVQSSLSTHPLALLRRHGRVPLLAVLLLLATSAAAYLLPAAALGLLWAGAPLWVAWAGRGRRPPRPLRAADREQLQGIALDTWGFFEHCIGPADRHLPPDNLQLLPVEVLAHRTSPTNIGLYLLSAACAQAFGWIAAAELVERLEATLASMAGLQRHRGHFLNWYDTQTGAALLPLYVSSVDSGNLCGHLLAVAQACRALAPEHADLGTRLLAIAARAEALAREADFAFLYHPRRHLLHIGYRVMEQQLDAACYDLLASESRLASLLAIAHGQLPVSHWTALGRPLHAVGTWACLRSWSGSMFEYLMPGLVLAEPWGSLLEESGRAALREQIDFARAHGLPWGISESAYAGRDQSLAYQYAPQGVPRLALRRSPPEELVIAPYATALAAQIAPDLACRNFSTLQALGARGRFGFIEALDFTPERQQTGEPCTPVATFMAHHQGMSLVALANVLLDGVAQRWAMANPHLQAVLSLLHERVPREIAHLRLPVLAGTPLAKQRPGPGQRRELRPGMSAVEPSHLLSNGRYRVALRPNGAGWSRWGMQDLTRWRDDALRDAWGHFFFLRPRPGAALVSLSQHPAPDNAADYRCVFHADRVCLTAGWSGLQTQLTVWVSPEDDLEFRQVELRNLGDEVLELELISVLEPTLAMAGADEAHPAFSNLFMRAEWLATQQALLFERRPRRAAEAGLLAAHFVAAAEPAPLAVRLQTQREHWLGRNRAPHEPVGDLMPPVAGELITGLDPICALALTLRIAPQAKALLTFATAAAGSAELLQAVIDKYRQPSHIERASLMSATLAGIQLRGLKIGAEHFAAVQSLSTALLLTLARPQREAPEMRSDRRLLWRFGLSGERPIVLVSAGAMQGLSLLRSLAQALRLWAWGGVACDLVVLNAEPASYQMSLQRELAALRERHQADAPEATAFVVLDASSLDASELETLHRLARLHFHADGRPFLRQVQAWTDWHEQALERREEGATTLVGRAVSARQATLAPVGRFERDSGEFRFNVGPGMRPPRPWINVLANPGFGAHLSESGGGGSWAQNSRLHALTAWSNDPVADPPSEHFLVQDLETRECWSVAPSAWGDGALRYRVAHGQGYSRITHDSGGLVLSATWCVDPVTALKQVQLLLRNHGKRRRRLRLIGLVEWQLGAGRGERADLATALYCQRLPVGRLQALLATRCEQAGGFGGATAFLALAPGEADEDADWSCDRRECFDARGRLQLPDHFGQQRAAGLDPCAALATRLNLAPGDSAERVFLLGHADSPAAARQLAAESALRPPGERLVLARAQWDELLNATTVSTPDPLFDALVNRWLLYQTVACRLWARAGFYQAGGATGFRDQLQDCLALSWAAPRLLREQILLCASRQYPEGDVQHWWHAPGGAGVRSHCSDDRLWLPWACIHYLRATGDAGLLGELCPFVEGAPVPEGAEDLYETPRASEGRASVYEHAARAVDCSLGVGVHGLPLIGGGDWNDGMNRVGHEGRGESVWLAWLLGRLVADFTPLAVARGEAARAQRWARAAAGWQAALEGPAWDGRWYRRAFFDDGSPLGAGANTEARIDLIAQAWSALSGLAPPERQQQAMAAVEAELVDPAAGLIRLLHPPLVSARPEAGYIQAYPAGVRENGGQYSHAGVWALMAQARLARHSLIGSGDCDLAYRYFCLLSPAHRSADPTQGAVYGLEPYVMAGDICSAQPYVGRGGWSWYTGAAAWLHRAALESIFGLRLEAESLSFAPCLPTQWPRAELSLRRAGRELRFVLLRGTPGETLALMESENAQLLRPGQVLAWPALRAPLSCFVMPLGD
ncbi:carbohydrate-binding protein [Roseateles sp. DAIF2]|uniref:GH36-type glycosyl hydrolase domain-containing protein n=1 Tax=Roseateles sp. DAIF2 TaxID=2714952 RepID=UPI0018A299BD|nr:glucoamylase family protein [Roseateles sp. DAIF2]QPF74049.1 carbohydrate-binding protein [Roseateles sp. DAIF2]